MHVARTYTQEALRFMSERLMINYNLSNKITQGHMTRALTKKKTYTNTVERGVVDKWKMLSPCLDGINIFCTQCASHLHNQYCLFCECLCVWSWSICLAVQRGVRPICDVWCIVKVLKIELSVESSNFVDIQQFCTILKQLKFKNMFKFPTENEGVKFKSDLACIQQLFLTVKPNYVKC